MNPKENDNEIIELTDEELDEIFAPELHKNRQHSTEVECRLFCCPILLGRCRFCSFLRLLSYRHTAYLPHFLFAIRLKRMIPPNRTALLFPCLWEIFSFLLRRQRFITR